MGEGRGMSNRSRAHTRSNTFPDSHSLCASADPLGAYALWRYGFVRRTRFDHASRFRLLRPARASNHIPIRQPGAHPLLCRSASVRPLGPRRPERKVRGNVLDVRWSSADEQLAITGNLRYMRSRAGTITRPVFLERLMGACPTGKSRLYDSSRELVLPPARKAAYEE